MDIHWSSRGYFHAELLAGPVRIHSTSCLTFSYMMLPGPPEDRSYIYLDYGVLGSNGFLTYSGSLYRKANLSENLAEWQQGNMSLNATGLFRPVFYVAGEGNVTVRLDNVRLRQMDCITTGK